MSVSRSLFETYENNPGDGLVFSELLLLSHNEKAATRITFHPSVTLILGRNDTGKSSLLKSLYSTLGASPAHTHPAWKSADTVSLLRFRLRDQRMAALHFGRQYAIFDAHDHVLISSDSVTNDLG